MKTSKKKTSAARAVVGVKTPDAEAPETEAVSSEVPDTEMSNVESADVESAQAEPAEVNPPSAELLDVAVPEPDDDIASDAPPAESSREALIREQAYRRYQARGGADGDSVQDWLDAEAEIDAASQAS